MQIVRTLRIHYGLYLFTVHVDKELLASQYTMYNYILISITLAMHRKYSHHYFGPFYSSRLIIYYIKRKHLAELPMATNGGYL